MNVLVIDVGGSHVKLLASGQPEPRRFDSGPDLTPQRLVGQVSHHTRDWGYAAVSVGYPGVVGPAGPVREPGNLGDGWVGFDFAAAFGKPVRLVNDAAMQAVGGYAGGRMLFLGLGTGLGSTLVTDRVVVPLELGCLPHPAGGTWPTASVKKGLDRLGREAWLEEVHTVAAAFRTAFAATDVILGGGHAEYVDPLPEGVRRGGNADAFAGGFRLWEEPVEPLTDAPAGAWRMVW